MAKISDHQAAGLSLDPLFFGTGMLLVLLQQLEHTVKLACEFLQGKGVQVERDGFLSEEPKKREQTLGQAIRVIRESTRFTPSFKEQLDTFVKNRNTFIHGYWIEKGVFSITDTLDLETFQEIASFEEDLSKKTVFMIEVFLGLHYAVGASIAQREGKSDEFENDPEFERMRKYAEVFLSVIETE